MSLALLNLAYYGVSIAPIPKALGYIFPRGGGNKVVFNLSAYGELALRIRSEIVTSINGPTLIYKGDDLKITNGKVFHDMAFKSEEITGGWITVNRPDGTSEDKYFSMKQLLSYKGNSTSEAWTAGIDKQPTKGMLEAKILRHTMDTYPLLDLGVMNKKGSFSPLAAEAALGNAYEELSTGAEDEDLTDDEDGTDEDVDAYTTDEEPAGNHQEAAKTTVKATKPEVKEEEDIPLDF